VYNSPGKKFALVTVSFKFITQKHKINRNKEIAQLHEKQHEINAAGKFRAFVARPSDFRKVQNGMRKQAMVSFWLIALAPHTLISETPPPSLVVFYSSCNDCFNVYGARKPIPVFMRLFPIAL